ncbi:MAG: COG1361 S-layer family protein [Candidatus Micrarchaeota archaeon]
MFLVAVAVCMLQLASFASAVKVGGFYYDPSPAKPGEYFTLRVIITNDISSPVRNGSLLLYPQYPFYLDSSESNLRIYSIEKQGDTMELRYKVLVSSDAQPGVVQLPYVILFGESQIASQFNIEITESNNLKVVGISPTTLAPGEQAKLVFTVQNLANASAKNVVFSWKDPESVIIPVGSESSQFAEGLQPMEKRDFAFDVIVDSSAETGAYTLNITLSSSTSNKTQSTTAGIVVGGQASLDLIAQDYSEGQISLAVANVGFNPATALSITIPQQQGIRISGPNTRFLGNLLKGDYTIANFQVTALQANAPGIQNRTGATPAPQSMRVVLEYTDTFGKRQSIQREIPISDLGQAVSTQAALANRNRNGGLLSLWPYAVVALIALGTIFWWYRKQKNQKTGVK